MSFSKAKIQRFNDCSNDVPPPGAYDPKFDTKVKGAVIEKSERFHDNKSTVSAECNLSLCTKSTGNAVTTFRTPQLPRKKLSVRPASRVKPRSLISNDPKLKYNSEHQIADLQVECSNKNETIREHEAYIDDMKEEIIRLEAQLEELRSKQEEVEEQHKKDIEAMIKLQQDVLTDHEEKYQAERDRLRVQLLEVSDEKEREIEARKVMECDLRNRIAVFSKRITALESEMAEKKRISEEKIQTLEAQIEELQTKQKELIEHHKLEVNTLEEENSKLNCCVNDLTDEREELELKLEKRQNVILELQAQLSALQCELDELRAEYEKLVEDSAKQVNELTHKHQKEIDKLNTDFETEKTLLDNDNKLEICHRLEAEAKLNDISEDNNFLKTELEDVQRLYKDVNSRLLCAYKELEESDKKHHLALIKHKEELANVIKLHNDEKLKLKQQIEDARLNYLKEIENLTMARDNEIAELEESTAKKIGEETKRMKEHADKMVENAETVTRETLAACRTECEERVKRVIAESDVKVTTMIRDAKAAMEEEMRLTAERYKACLARVELERSVLDDKIAQKDAEINRLSEDLEELRCSAETQESFGQSLQMELDKAEGELAEKKEELRALKDQIRSEAAEMVARKKRLELIMAENQASVAALTKRLEQSDAEVERLQHELRRGGDCIYEHRDILSIMSKNSQMVHALMEQLDANAGLVNQIEAESLKEVESMRSLFETKIEDFRHIASKEIKKLQADYDAKNSQHAEMRSQLQEMASRLNEADDMLLKLEERNDSQELEIAQVELLNNKLKEQLESNTATIEETRKLLESQSVKHATELEEANSKVEELSDKIKCLEEEDKSARRKDALLDEERTKWRILEDTLMEQLEYEKSRREAAEVKIKILTEHNERLTKDYQEISEKYAEVVGHQNHRQRIKHVSQLKDKIKQLEQDLFTRAKTIEQKQKIIDKLKAEDKQRAFGKGKENMLGIPKSAHTTPVSSPHKPLTPLRSRND